MLKSAAPYKGALTLKSNPANPNSERITVQLPPDEKAYIEVKATEQGRSTSAEALVRLRQSYGSDFKVKPTKPAKTTKAKVAKK
jgi:hypothetical protein